MKSPLIDAFLLFLILTLAGCSVIAGVFKTGVWVGVVGVLLVIVLIVTLTRKK